MIRMTRFALLRSAAASAAAVALVATIATLPLTATDTPTIGSPNTVTAAPGVPRPSTTPCTVPLFNGFQFADFSPKPFTFTPPAACPGPWAKVVLEVDLSIDAGVQFDRTAQIALDHVNIYYGTTAEPSSKFGPSWHVERDLTDYSALFTQAQTGEVNHGNVVNSTYTSVLTGSATLQFYPIGAGAPAARTPDVVMSLSTDPGGATLLMDGTSTLAPTLKLPTNIEGAYLDVIAQSQHSDEFWYTCVPDADASILQSCPGTAFRETEIAIDGRPAGVAPVRPWIFTGGIDPELWSPLPGVQTLNFEPYRVDLTPFAGELSDGKPHQVSVRVYNADDYFLVSAALLLDLDAGATQVTGAVTGNSLSAAPVPQVTQSVRVHHDGGVNASVVTSSTRSFTIKGFVNTSHGKVSTTLNEEVDFSNRQVFTITPSTYQQNIGQTTNVSITRRTQGEKGNSSSSQHASYPLTVDIGLAFNSDGSGSQTTAIDQQFLHDDRTGGSAVPGAASSVSAATTTRDTLFFSAQGNITAFKGQQSSQRFFEEATDGLCYSRALASRNGLLTAIDDGEGCPGGVNSF
jgi:hypothetical protein